MTTQELEAAILEGVQASYKKKYIGRLKVVPIANGYQMKMWLNHPEAPLVIAAELSDSKFLSFIMKELKSRHLELTEYFTGFLPKIASLKLAFITFDFSFNNTIKPSGFWSSKPDFVLISG